MTTETFVSEPIKPMIETADTSRMAAGTPGLPAAFSWRGEELRIVAVLRAWKETGTCRHSRTEQYLRKHWYEVELSSGQRAKLYFERKARSGSLKKRWWLYTIEEGP